MIFWFLLRLLCNLRCRKKQVLQYFHPFSFLQMEQFFFQFDSNNRPHLLFNNNLNWTHAHFDGTEWTVTAITTKSTVNLHVSACLIVDSDTNLRAYLQFSPPGDSAATWSTTEEYRSTNAGATWAFYQTLQGMTYRGLLNHIKNGTDGYRILAASSETDPHDIWIY